MKYRVNIDLANTTKAGLAGILDNRDRRVLNRVGAFASLFLPNLQKYKEPVLVLKTEEPGSKQVLAFQHDRVESVVTDMINHLINDCIAVGAEPLAVQDLVVCGAIDESIVKHIVSAAAAACEAQGCCLTGGETSEQPDVLSAGTYILGSSIIGIVERSKIIDGSHIAPGDVVIAIGSSGPHTNGYTLIRDLLKKDPSLQQRPIGDTNFLEAVLRPHRCYYRSVKNLFDGHITGMAHITGGGIAENLNRILPPNCDASIDLRQYRPQPVFGVIRDVAQVASEEMLRAFNLGVGMAVVCRSEHVKCVLEHLKAGSEIAYVIGEIVEGAGNVIFHGELDLGI